MRLAKCNRTKKRNITVDYAALIGPTITPTNFPKFVYRNWDKDMPTINYKGQITIPKKIRKSLNLKSGMQLDIAINQNSKIILKKIIQEKIYPIDRFELARGEAEIKWRTNDLMQLLRN